MSTTIDEAIRQAKEINDGFQAFFDKVNWFLQRVPEALEHLIKPIVEAMRRLSSKISEFWAKIKPYLDVTGSPWKLERYSEVLIQQVAKKLNTVADDVAMDRLATNTGWTGSGAEAYKAIVPAQGDGLSDLGDLATDLGNTLKELANAIENFWIAILFALLALAVGIAAAIAELVSLVGAPVAPVTVIAAVGTALAFITTAAIELKNIYDTIDTSQDTISQGIEKVGDEWAKATPRNQVKIDDPRYWRPIDAGPVVPRIGGAGPGQGRPQVPRPALPQAPGLPAVPGSRPQVPALPDVPGSSDPIGPQAPGLPSVPGSPDPVRPPVLPDLASPPVPPVPTGPPVPPGPAMPGPDPLPGIPPPPPPPASPGVVGTDPPSVGVAPGGPGPIRSDPALGTVPSGAGLSSVLNPELSGPGTSAQAAGQGGADPLRAPGAGNLTGVRLPDGPPPGAGSAGGVGNVGAAPTSPAGRGGLARPVGAAPGQPLGTAAGAQSPGQGARGGAAAPAAPGGPGQFGGFPLAGGMGAGNGDDEDITHKSKYRIQGDLFDDTDPGDDFGGVVGTDPANRSDRAKR